MQQKAAARERREALEAEQRRAERGRGMRRRLASANVRRIARITARLAVSRATTAAAMARRPNAIAPFGVIA